MCQMQVWEIHIWQQPDGKKYDPCNVGISHPSGFKNFKKFYLSLPAGLVSAMGGFGGLK